MTELGARWLVEMHEYIASSPQLIVNGFLRSGITTALDANLRCDEHNTSHNDSEGDDESEMLYTDEDNEVGTNEYDESADDD